MIFFTIVYSMMRSSLSWSLRSWQKPIYPNKESNLAPLYNFCCQFTADCLHSERPPDELGSGLRRQFGEKGRRSDPQVPAYPRDRRSCVPPRVDIPLPDRAPVLRLPRQHRHAQPSRDVGEGRPCRSLRVLARRRATEVLDPSRSLERRGRVRSYPFSSSCLIKIIETCKY